MNPWNRNPHICLHSGGGQSSLHWPRLSRQAAMNTPCCPAICPRSHDSVLRRYCLQSLSACKTRPELQAQPGQLAKIVASQGDFTCSETLIGHQGNRPFGKACGTVRCLRDCCKPLSESAFPAASASGDLVCQSPGSNRNRDTGNFSRDAVGTSYRQGNSNG